MGNQRDMSRHFSSNVNNDVIDDVMGDVICEVVGGLWRGHGLWLAQWTITGEFLCLKHGIMTDIFTKLL